MKKEIGIDLNLIKRIYWYTLLLIAEHSVGAPFSVSHHDGIVDNLLSAIKLFKRVKRMHLPGH